MQKEIKTKRLKLTASLKNKTPWAIIWVKVESGFLAFETYEEFEKWKEIK